jgi:hypothetical protein
MVAERTRFTLDLEPELHGRLKVVAARKGTTMRRYCLEAIERQMAQEPQEYLSSETDPVLAELWDNDEDAVYDEL